MQDVFLPAWSSDALAARDVFFDAYNGVNFYVEDEEQENLYHLVLKRLFPSIRITQIFPLKGKENVLAHAKDPTNLPRASRCVYILDKDFDDLLGKVIEQGNVFYLRKFCIENFLLEPDAFIEVVIEEQPRKKRTTVESTLKLPAFLENSIESLNLLFRLFYIVQALDLGLRNCGCAVERFAQEASRYKVDAELVDTYRREVQTAALESGKCKTPEEFCKLVESAFPKDAEPDSNISGKYLLALVSHHIKRHLNWGTVTADSITYRLARHSTLRELESLKVDVNVYLGV